MPFETIAKPAAADLPVSPNIGDYEKQRASFNWEDVAKELDGLPEVIINTTNPNDPPHYREIRTTCPADADAYPLTTPARRSTARIARTLVPMRDPRRARRPREW